MEESINLSVDDFIIEGVEKNPITTGARLKTLIIEKCQTQSEFVKEFAEWCDIHHPDTKPYPQGKDVSRWVNDKVVPRQERLKMFAEFFGVNVDYLDCKISVKEKRGRKEIKNGFKSLAQTNIQVANLPEKVQRVFKIRDFTSYLKNTGFIFESVPTKFADSAYRTTYEFCDDGFSYTLHLVFPNLKVQEESECKTVVTMPDGQTMQITDEQLYALIKECDSFINFKFSELRKEVKENDK